MSEFALVKSTILELDREESFDLIAKGKVFELTGANSIEFDFRKSGKFKLSFSDRGLISGEFHAIERPATVDVSWEVSGFSRPTEYSKVIFSFKAVDKGMTELEIRHLQMERCQS